MAINTTTVECSTSPSLISPNIKNENHRTDDRAKFEKLSPKQQTPATAIAFSITNILSNTFGNNKVISEKKNGFVFRPYDNNNDVCGETSPKKFEIDQRSDDESSNGEFRKYLSFIFAFFFSSVSCFGKEFLFAGTKLTIYIAHFSIGLRSCNRNFEYFKCDVKLR